MRACVWTRLAKATATAVLIEAITLKRASCALRKYFSDNRIWHSVWLSERVSNSECQRCKTKKKETSGYRAVFVSGSPSRRQTTAVSSKCRRTIGILVNQSGDYKLKHCIFLRCAVVPKMATYEPAACSFQIALFFFLLLRFFWIFVLISASGSGGQLKQVNHITACSAMGCRNMITFASKGRRRSGSCVTQVPKRKKDSPTPFLHPTSVPRWQAHFKLLSATCLIWTHTSEELKASVCLDSILKIIAISQQPLHYYTFVKREILKRQKEHRRENARLEKSLHKQKMRHEFGIPSITPIICSWKKMHQAGRYISKRGQQGLDKKSHWEHKLKS